MAESSIQRRVWMALSAVGARLFRNQVGLYTLQDGRKLRSGLCVGSSDLIGWRTIEIGPRDVGRLIAQFVAVEIKSETGVESDAQERFRKAVRRGGGVAIVARSEEQAVIELKDS